MRPAFRSNVEQALKEVKGALAPLTSDTIQAFVTEVIEASRIAVYGVGREGLTLKGLAMRLFHLGLDSNVVGDMTAAPIRPGDLLIVSAGPGEFSTVLALMDVAKGAGARTLVLTAMTDGVAASRADVVVTLDAQTMASERTQSMLPMGSLYELSLWLLFDLVVLMLQERLQVTSTSMRSRHTNLE